MFHVEHTPNIPIYGQSSQFAQILDYTTHAGRFRVLYQIGEYSYAHGSMDATVCDFHKDANLTLKNGTSRVSLSFGNWIGLITLVAFLLGGMGAMYLGLVEQIGEINATNDVQNVRLDHLERGKQ